MKTVGALLFAAVLAFGLAPARGQEEDAKGGDELKALDAKLTEAFKKHDVKELEKYAADDMLVIDPLGRVHDKKQYFEHLEKGKPKFDEFKESDVKVRLFGDTGVVTGLVNVKGMVNDKDVTGEYRWTRVYHKKKGGEWQVVSEQHTYVLPPEKPK